MQYIRMSGDELDRHAYVRSLPPAVHVSTGSGGVALMKVVGVNGRVLGLGVWQNIQPHIKIIAADADAVAVIDENGLWQPKWPALKPHEAWAEAMQ